ncbi:MAG: TadE/TadG family type IV pilus assembly protein [Candidatus Binatia bacterium]
MVFRRKVLHSQSGQGIIELGLALPLLLLLSLGAIELSNMISTYLTLTHLTREGANLTSRGDGTSGDITASLDAIITASKPALCSDGIGCTQNLGQWTVIYSQIVPDPTNNPNLYQIKRDGADWVRGSLGQTSKIGSDGNTVNWAEFGIDPASVTLTAGQTFHVVEVFYDYGPSKLTPIDNLTGNLLPELFYDRTIFRDVT